MTTVIRCVKKRVVYTMLDIIVITFGLLMQPFAGIAGNRTFLQKILDIEGAPAREEVEAATEFKGKPAILTKDGQILRYENGNWSSTDVPEGNFIGMSISAENCRNISSQDKGDYVFQNDLGEIIVYKIVGGELYPKDYLGTFELYDDIGIGHFGRYCFINGITSEGEVKNLIPGNGKKVANLVIYLVLWKNL